MSEALARIKAQAAAVAEVSDDFNEATAGGGGGRLLKEGPVVARLVSYVDFGKQPQEFGGKPKDPANEFKLGFALYGPDYLNEDGTTPYVIETYGIAESRNNKAGAFLLFQAMNWKKQATAFPQLIGELFIVDIKTHTPKKEGSKPRSIVNLKTVRAALDPMTSAEYQAPPVPDSYYQMFSYKKPTLEAWDSLFRDGQWDDGASKNRVQETILSAVDFAGSELEALLLSSNRTFVIPAKKAAVATAPAAPEVATPAPLAQPATPVVAPVVAAPSVIGTAPVVVTEVATVATAASVQPTQPTAVTPSPSEVAAPVVVAPVVAPPVVNLPPPLVQAPTV